MHYDDLKEMASPERTPPRSQPTSRNKLRKTACCSSVILYGPGEKIRKRKKERHPFSGASHIIHSRDSEQGHSEARNTMVLLQGDADSAVARLRSSITPAWRPPRPLARRHAGSAPPRNPRPYARRLTPRWGLAVPARAFVHVHAVHAPALVGARHAVGEQEGVAARAGPARVRLCARRIASVGVASLPVRVRASRVDRCACVSCRRTRPGPRAPGPALR